MSKANRNMFFSSEEELEENSNIDNPNVLNRYREDFARLDPEIKENTTLFYWLSSKKTFIPKTLIEKLTAEELLADSADGSICGSHYLLQFILFTQISNDLVFIQHAKKEIIESAIHKKDAEGRDFSEYLEAVMDRVFRLKNTFNPLFYLFLVANSVPVDRSWIIHLIDKRGMSGALHSYPFVDSFNEKLNAVIREKQARLISSELQNLSVEDKPKRLSL